VSRDIAEAHFEKGECCDRGEPNQPRIDLHTRLPVQNLMRDATRRALGTKHALGIPLEHLNLRMGLRLESI
jgi:hypothetical protein